MPEIVIRAANTPVAIRPAIRTLLPAPAFPLLASVSNGEPKVRPVSIVCMALPFSSPSRGPASVPLRDSD